MAVASASVSPASPDDIPCVWQRVKIPFAVSSSSLILLHGLHTAMMVLPSIFMTAAPSFAIYSAGAHLQRTGETIAPSSLSSFIALSTSLRSRPLSSAILPAFRGCPASFIVANTFSFTSMMILIFVVDSCYYKKQESPCRFISRLQTYPETISVPDRSG